MIEEKIKEEKSELKAMKANKLTSENLVPIISQRIMPHLFVTSKSSNIGLSRIAQKRKIDMDMEQALIQSIIDGK